MTGGRWAREQAERASAAQEVLERKAESAARAATSYERGAVGEEMVAAALSGLTGRGWFVLHDRCLAAGGNLDHIAIGPPGVAVIDAKNWSAAVSVEEGRLHAGGRTRQKSVDRLHEQVAHVVAALRDRGIEGVPVRGFLAMTGADRGLGRHDLGDVRVVGVDRLEALLAAAGHAIPEATKEAALRELTIAFPPQSDQAASPAPVDVEAAEGTDRSGWKEDLYQRGNRLFYIREWRKGGKHRLYANGVDGARLGWKDVISGEVTVECEGDMARLAQAVLGSADPGGVRLAATDLPKVPVELLGGRLIGRLGRLWVMVRVGQEWRKGRQHRLYGTLIDHELGRVDLGFVDLVTGRPHPSFDGEVAKGYGTPERYLEDLRDRRPAPGGRSEG